VLKIVGGAALTFADAFTLGIASTAGKGVYAAGVVSYNLLKNTGVRAVYGLIGLGSTKVVSEAVKLGGGDPNSTAAYIASIALTEAVGRGALPPGMLGLSAGQQPWWGDPSRARRRFEQLKSLPFLTGTQKEELRQLELLSKRGFSMRPTVSEASKPIAEAPKPAPTPAVKPAAPVVEARAPAAALSSLSFYKLIEQGGFKPIGPIGPGGKLGYLAEKGRRKYLILTEQAGKKTWEDLHDAIPPSLRVKTSSLMGQPRTQIEIGGGKKVYAILLRETLEEMKMRAQLEFKSVQNELRQAGFEKCVFQPTGGIQGAVLAEKGGKTYFIVRAEDVTSTNNPAFDAGMPRKITPVIETETNAVIGGVRVKIYEAKKGLGLH